MTTAFSTVFVIFVASCPVFLQRLRAKHCVKSVVFGVFLVCIFLHLD